MADSPSGRPAAGELPVVCPHCGERAPADANCCGHCGGDLGVATAETLVDSSPAMVAAVPQTVRVDQPLAPRETAPEDRVGQEIGGRFRILSLLGEGGMGAVYLAQQLAVDRRVALKFLRVDVVGDESLAERFQREARAVSQLAAPNTIVLHDYGTSERGQPFMAMEYLEGQSLAELISSSGGLPPWRAVAIALQILASLEEAHEKGIVHRDLKPENIMLVSRGGTRDFVKVVDFGIAKLLADDQPDATADEVSTTSDSGLTQQGAIFGSPRYMAPEQATARPVSPQTDIYAVGVILYEMLCGEPPFTSGSTMQLLHDQAFATIPPLHERFPQLDLPRELVELIDSCLHKDAAERPRSARAVARSLREVIEKLARLQESEDQALLELVGIRKRWRRAVRWLLPTALAVLVLVPGTWWLARRGAGGPRATLAAGARVFVAASRRTIPAWVAAIDRRHPSRARVTGLATAEAAIQLARARAVVQLLGLPLRFDAEREPRRFMVDLQRVAEIYARVVPPLPVKASLWVEVAVGRRGGGVARRFDGYVELQPPTATQRRALDRAFAELRYDNYAHLCFKAVTAGRCVEARALGVKVTRAIEQMAVDKARKRVMRSTLELQLRSCRTAGAR